MSSILRFQMLLTASMEFSELRRQLLDTYSEAEDINEQKGKVAVL